MDVKVYYEDTDCGGVVYYANYLKYFERARTEFLESAQFSLLKWMGEGILFTVVYCEIFYLHPAKYRDLLWIDTQLISVTRTTLVFDYQITQKNSGRLIVKGTTKLASIGPNGKIKRLPQEIVDHLSSFQKSSF